MASVLKVLLAWVTNGASYLVDKVLQPLLMPLVLADLVPDFLIRFGIKLMLGGLLSSLDKGNPSDNVKAKLEYVKDLKTRVIAESTDDANSQHYEVPSSFYDLCLGPWKKYSCGLWPEGCDSLEASEEEALRVVCERAKITNTKLRILDMGCGWGSATLYIASHFPAVSVVSVSNSSSQRAYIEGQAKKRGLNNITVITSDINNFEAPVAEEQGGKFDRVVSIEMIEHTKNWEKLFGKVSSWLKPDTGLFFMHIFTHHSFPFHYVDGYMAKTWFTGGQMPSDDLPLYFQKDLALKDHWLLNGKHYERTCNEWLRKLDSNREAALAVAKKVYGDKQALARFVDWRLFFIACAELFGYKNGNEWAVSHYLFANKGSSGAGSHHEDGGIALDAAPSSSGGRRGGATRRH